MPGYYFLVSRSSTSMVNNLAQELNMFKNLPKDISMALFPVFDFSLRFWDPDLSLTCYNFLL